MVIIRAACLFSVESLETCLLRILGEFPLQQGLLLSVAEWEPSVLPAWYFSLLGLELGVEVSVVRVLVSVVQCNRQARLV